LDLKADASDTSDLWNDITPIARWEWVRWINATKDPDTRKRPINVGISKLRSGAKGLRARSRAWCPRRVGRG